MSNIDDPPIDKPKALVTGGSGMLGAHLIIKLLQDGHKVKALYRQSVPDFPTSTQVEWVRGDILDVLLLEAAMQDVEHVYHCAAIVSFNDSRKDEMYKTNIEGTANVVNSALQSGVQKLCHVSSVAVFGKPITSTPIDEGEDFNEVKTNSNYGKSKYMAEMEVWRGIAEGLKAVIINPSIILGAGNWNESSSKIFKTAYDEFAWFTEGVTGFVDVEDVTKAMLLLMNSEISGQRFILSAENLTYKTVFSTIANGFNKKPPHKKVTPFIAGIVRRLEGLKSIFGNKDPLLTKETAEAALMEVRYNNEKLKSYLSGFEYSPISSTIKRVCDEFKTKYKLQ